jgi:4-diphosphocytidyl-2C-methyl-D-erythritol kinase
MSGSGSTVFGLYRDSLAAQAAVDSLKGDSGHVTAFQTISRRQYQRAWQDALASLADGVCWPPRS